ncbi:ribonuclease P protein component 1 [Halomicrococcus sp. NG-SE-24]|uniref:ribonuclease P protein component 1 n=1 Tax=unclassified Halomicrococcus TaxID=2614448 RepID=UPI003D95E89F
MALTPETLPKHELVGLHVRVVSATNPDLVGIEGRVVDETMRTLSVESASRVRQVQKRGTKFEFRLTDEAADSERTSGTVPELQSETAGVRSGQSGCCEGTAYVTVDGAILLSRPELRTESGGISKWR